MVLRDEIINREQEKLDAYASIGALIGSPTVEFLESDNTTTDMMNGDFVWNAIATTRKTPMKPSRYRPSIATRSSKRTRNCANSAISWRN